MLHSEHLLPIPSGDHIGCGVATLVSLQGQQTRSLHGLAKGLMAECDDVNGSCRRSILIVEDSFDNSRTACHRRHCAKRRRPSRSSVRMAEYARATAVRTYKCSPILASAR